MYIRNLVYLSFSRKKVKMIFILNDSTEMKSKEFGGVLRAVKSGLDRAFLCGVVKCFRLVGRSHNPASIIRGALLFSYRSGAADKAGPRGVATVKGNVLLRQVDADYINPRTTTLDKSLTSLSPGIWHSR